MSPPRLKLKATTPSTSSRIVKYVATDEKRVQSNAKSDVRVQLTAPNWCSSQ